MTGYIICQVRSETKPNIGRCWHRDTWGEAVEFLVAFLESEYGVDCDREEIESDYGIEVQTPLDGQHRFVFALLEPE